MSMLLFRRLRNIKPDYKDPNRPRVTLHNVLLALKDQLPLTRLVKNLWKGHIFGLFHERSHFRDTGQAKVVYRTKESATKAAASMRKKRSGIWFSNYKCIYCDGYHIGKTSENKGAAH